MSGTVSPILRIALIGGICFVGAIIYRQFGVDKLSFREHEANLDGGFSDNHEAYVYGDLGHFVMAINNAKDILERQACRERARIWLFVHYKSLDQKSSDFVKSHIPYLIPRNVKFG